jgi:type I restriction enzyme S subunit
MTAQVPLKRVALLNPETLGEGTDPDRFFRYIDIATTGHGVLLDEPQAMTFATSPSRARRVLRPGDTILSTVRTYLRAGWTLRSTDGDLVASTGFVCLRPRSYVHPGFLGWLAQADTVVEEVVANSAGVSYPAINASDVGRIKVPCPPIADQRAIADYLDRETSRIDALLAAKRRMVALWHERRVSAAHSTVVGAQLDTERRPAGVPWLGDIPSHWRMARVGSLFEVQLGRMLSAERSAGPHLRRYLRNVNVRWGSVDTSDLAEMDFPPADRVRYLVRAGDLLVNEGGAGIGRAAIWDGEIEEIYYQKSVHRIRPRGDVTVRWLLEWLRVVVNRHVFAVEGNLATIPHVPAEALRQYRVPCPPRDEADALIAALDSSVARDAAGLLATEAQIDLLTERRQALITAAVTGLLRIPEAA